MATNHNILIFLFLFSTVHADRITFNDGVQSNGTITKMTDSTISFRKVGNSEEVTLPRNRIKSYEIRDADTALIQPAYSTNTVILGNASGARMRRYSGRNICLEGVSGLGFGMAGFATSSVATYLFVGHNLKVTDEDPRPVLYAYAFLAGMVGYAIGSPVGVCWAGKRLGENGNVIITSAGSIFGLLIAGALLIKQPYIGIGAEALAVPAFNVILYQITF